MPVIAIVAAVGTFAAGATAFAAATTIGASIMAGAAMVGSALTIIGTVTGNQKLTMLGGVLTLGAGLAGGMANPFGGAEAAGAAGASEAGMIGSDAAEAARMTAQESFRASELASGAQQAGTSTMAIPDALSAAADVAPSQTGMIGQATAEAAQAAPLPPDVATQVTQASPFNASPESGAFSADKTNAFSTTQAGQPDAFNASIGNDQAAQEAFRRNEIVAGNAAPSSSPGMIDRFSSWAKTNPELAKAFLETSKGFIGNLVPSDVDKARTASYNAQANLTAQQAADAKRRALWATGRIA